MGWLLLILYVIAAAALLVSFYNYLTIQDLAKSTKFNSQNNRRVEGKIDNLEKIIGNKKWTWK